MTDNDKSRHDAATGKLFDELKYYLKNTTSGQLVYKAINGDCNAEYAASLDPFMSGLTTLLMSLGEHLTSPVTDKKTRSESTDKIKNFMSADFLDQLVNYLQMDREGAIANTAIHGDNEALKRVQSSPFLSGVTAIIINIKGHFMTINTPDDIPNDDESDETDERPSM